MKKEKKAEAVDKLADALSRSTVAVFTDYRGLSVAQMNELRRSLRALAIEYRVVKNTLVRFAAEKAGKQGLAHLLEGPTAIAFGYGNVTEPARALADYIRASRTTLRIKGGLLDKGVLAPAEVSLLSTLPSKEDLVAKLLCGMQAPLSGLVYILSAQISGLARVLQARIQGLEGG
ncbi:50S ribosomal protein L10 [Chloroflexota bacterium]